MSGPADTYLLKIDGVRPAQMPLAKFIEYVRAAEQMLGVGEGLHLVGIRDASTGAAILIDSEYRQKAESNVVGAPAGLGSRSVQRGYRRLERLAQNDNLPVTFMRPDGAPLLTIVPMAVDDEAIGPVRQEGSLQGHVVGVVGQDDTKHVRLQDGELVYTGIEADEHLAAELGKHLFVPVVRLRGTGWWSRKGDSGWSLHRFKATDFDVLDDKSLLDVVNELRSLSASEWHGLADPWDELQDLRGDA